MALSGNFTNAFTDGISFYTTWSATQSITNNTSTITVKNYLNLTSSGASIGINAKSGTNVVGTSSQSFASGTISAKGVQSILLGTTTHTISHNTDGSKSATLTATFNIAATLNLVYYASVTNTATITLDTIPRASTISLSSSSVVFGNSITTTISRASTSFTHTVKYSLGSYSSTSSSVATSNTFTVPLTWMNAVPSATSGTVTVTVTTYSGSTAIGSTSATFKATVPTTVVPSFTTLNIERIDNVIPEDWGIYVQGYSQATLTISGESTQYGATITKRAITYTSDAGGGGATGTATTFTTSVLYASGDVTFTATITDSRGRTASKTSTIYIEPYIVPQFGDTTVYRSNEGGVADINGNYITVKPSIEISSLDENNTILVTADGESVPNNGTLILDGKSSDNNYYINIIATDELSINTKQYFVASAIVPMDFHKSGKGAAMGKVSETENLFEVDMPAQFNYGAFINGLYPIGAIYMSTVNTNPSTYFGGTWEQWGAGRVPVGVDTSDSDFNAVEQTGGDKSRAIMAAINWSANSDNVSIKRLTGQTQWTANRVTASTLPGLSSSSTSFSYGVQVLDYATAENPSLVQPYITCYMWKRTA